jgi:hypothetical protein
MTALQQLAQRIEDNSRELGHIPTYSAIAKRKYMYVYKKHYIKDCYGKMGFATFVGKYDYEEALNHFADLLGFMGEA